MNKIYQFFVNKLQNYHGSRAISRYGLPDGYERFYLYHIRKTGGTSLNHMFLSVSGEPGGELYKKLPDAPGCRISCNGKVFVGWNKDLIEEGKYFYAFSHLPYHQLNIPDKTFAITCLRNPIDRVVSHYKMLMYFKKNKIMHPCMKLEGKWLGESFEDFLNLIPKEHLLNQLYMFSDSYDVEEAYNNILSTSYYFFTDSFEEGISVLSKMLDYQLTVKHEKKSLDQTFINTKTTKMLLNILRPEISLYEKLQKKWIETHNTRL